MAAVGQSGVPAAQRRTGGWGFVTGSGGDFGAERADEDGPVDLIITNAQVFTGAPGAELAEAVAIRGDKILRVGSNRDIKRLRRPGWAAPGTSSWAWVNSGG